MRRIIVKTKLASSLLRVLLWISVFALITLLFYAWHEDGTWKDIIKFYRFFFEPKRLKTFVVSFGPFASVMFVIIQSAQVVFAPIPGEVTGFVGGLLFGKAKGLILSTIGLTLGSLLAFTISRVFGIKVVEKIVKKEYIDKFNNFATHKGLNITFILFLLPGFPKDSLCYLLGLSRMKLADFLFMNIFGRLPGTLMLTMQGDAVGHKKYQAFFWLLVLSIAFTAILYFTRNYIMRWFGNAVQRFLLLKNKNKRHKSIIPDNKDT
ncbi:MAG TPA: VTT domain-containing protein [Syntrophorhabdaceae bacterium]|nr:TVP38/TMEM64 family protein [Syntrophorhabdaceae bacterium]HOF56954.1 VTT domain-containing protein [Syntrophorhabdaceae bacterium]HOS04532.1 VTT domain-containing protein [Syntrophorhabdaceae bacterium]HPL40119.1 VTT domain-containing protein [Syntrophorhabdaceae bacterium]HQP51241.1 VTT domain-containing protein [Syntrophorhabdaceae bacterium]